MRRRTIYVILGLLLVAAAGGVVLWRVRIARSPTNEVARSATVETGTMVVAVTATGRIEPATRVGLTFESPGRVAEVLVVEGDLVEAGDPLARVDTSQLQLQVEQSRGALKAAEAQLAQLRAGPRPEEIEQAEANLRSTEAQVSAAVANRNQVAAGPTDAEIAAAEAQMVQARTSKEIAQDSYDLIGEEGTKKEQANYDLYTAKQELAAAQARLEDLLTGPSSAELRGAESGVAAAAAQRDAAQAQLDQLLAGPSEEDIAEAEAQVRQAEVALELAEYSLDRATMRAPFRGIVAEVNMTPGEMPPTREAPVLLVDNSAYHLTVAVDELDVSQLREGQKAEISVEALPDADVSGTVTTIDPIAHEETGVVAYDVDIEVDEAEAPLRADLSANATIVVEELEEVLRFPSWAVQIDRETGETFVLRRRGEEIERVAVELGVRQNGVVQAVSGLSDGDEVVRLNEDATLSFEAP